MENKITKQEFKSIKGKLKKMLYDETCDCSGEVPDELVERVLKITETKYEDLADNSITDKFINDTFEEFRLTLNAIAVSWGDEDGRF